MSLYLESHQALVRASAWYEGAVSIEEVPIIGGSVKSELTAQVPQSVTLSVPITLTPRTPLDPLNKNGQELVLQRGRLYQGAPLLHDLGTFRIASWRASAPTGSLEVEAVNQADRLREARLESPLSPAGGTPYVDVAERLVDGILPLEVDASLPSRTVPSGITWEEDRLGALFELAEAWPARFHVTPDGVATFSPVLTDVLTEAPVATFSADASSTVVEYQPQGSREGYYNAVIARGQEDASGGKAAVQAAAYLASYGEPYGRVPAFYSSPLLTTPAQALKAAQTRLGAFSRPVAVLSVSAIPDPRLYVGDVVGVSLEGKDWLGRITSLEMPLSPAETMALTVEGVLS